MKQIKMLLIEIALLTNEATSKEEAINKGLNRYLAIDFASCYGGYRIVNVNIGSGGHSGALNQSSCCKRMSKKEMINFLSDVLTGLQTTK
jgi:hypothetical protein